MAKTLQFRRGTSAELDQITGAAGEMFIDLTSNSIRVHDGNTAGGTKIATESFVSNAMPTGYTGSAGGAAIANGLFVDGTLTVSNAILPTASNVIDIGSPTMRFGTLYLAGNTIDLGSTQISADPVGQIVFNTQAGNVSLGANTINFLSAVANTTQTAGDFSITGNVTAGAYYFTDGESAATKIISRRYTANGNSLTFSVTGNISAGSVFVFKDGTILEPGLDYIVSDGVLIFDQLPAAGDKLQIREFVNSNSTITDLSLPKITSLTVTNSQYVPTGARTVKSNGGYIKITGKNFASGATLELGSTAIPTVTVISSTEIRSEIPPSSEGVYNLKIKNSDGSFDQKFNYLRITSPIVNDSWVYSTSIIDSPTWGNSHIRDIDSAVSDGNTIHLSGQGEPGEPHYTYSSYTDINSILGNVETWVGNQRFTYRFRDMLWDGTDYYGIGSQIFEGQGIFRSNVGVTQAGYTFTRLTTTQNYLFTISVNNDKNKYVAGGDLGTLIVSSNGTSWNINESLKNNGWRDTPLSTADNQDKVNKIIWNDTKFIAFGDKGKIATSDDGEIWAYNTSLRETDWGTTSNILTASKSISSGLIFAGGQNGSFATSQDGNTWIFHSGLTTDTNWGNININEIVCMPVVVNNNNIERVIVLGDQLKIAYSDNFGNTWTISSTIYDTLYPGEINNWVTYVDLPDNEILAFGTNGIAARIKSNLQIINVESLRNSGWKSTSIPDCTAIGWNGSQFVVGSSTVYTNDIHNRVKSYVAHSSDGITWSEPQQIQGERITQILWDGTKTITIGHQSTINYSFDGTTWFENTSPLRLDRGGTVIHAGGSYGTNLIVTDPRIAYNGNIYVALGRSFVLCTSTNGLDWTLRGIFAGLNLAQLKPSPGTAQVDYTTDIIWAGDFESGKFLAVGHGMNEVFESVDGINWTIRPTSLSSINWENFLVGDAIFERIVWTGAQFFIITSYSTVLQSNDGTTWSMHRTLEQNTTEWNVPSQSAYLFDKVRTRAALWDGEKLILTNTVNSKIAVSYDGIDWNISNKLFNGDWNNGTSKNYQDGILDMIQADERLVVVGNFGKVASGNIS